MFYKGALSTAFLYGSISSNNDPQFVGLYEMHGKVSKRFNQLAEERQKKIKALYAEELKKLEQASAEYLSYIESRKGEMVAYVPTTSRASPRSVYFSGIVAQGGIGEDASRDAEKINEDTEKSHTNTAPSSF